MSTSFALLLGMGFLMLGNGFPVSTEDDNFELVIVHTNDVHSRFVETSVSGGKCRQSGSCYGGFARMRTAIENIRANNDHVVLLDGGDQFQGTLWFTKFKGNVVAKFMKILEYDAMALGNHEFDDQIPTLINFMEKLNFPVLSSNIDATREPSLQKLLVKSTILTRNDKKIGVIGYTTTSTPIISTPGKVQFRQEVESIQQEVDNMTSEGVDIIIALGHSGVVIDQEIAAQVRGVDVVVGAHSHTFMYTVPENGALPDIEQPMFSYPLMVDSVVEPGKRVPVVQAFEYGKYLGKLHVVFDGNGDLLSANGNPLLLDDSILQDSSTLEAMKPFSKRLMKLNTQIIGHTYVYLDGTRFSCRLQECNLGNLITDAMVDEYQIYPNIERQVYSPMIAIFNGGGIRSPIESLNNGEITAGEVSTVLPFGGTFDIINLEGKYLLEAFQYSANKFDNVTQPGSFLQVSGIKVVYDMRKEIDNRVVSLEVLCNDFVRCPVPVYEPVKNNEIYRILINDFLAHGGDGYTMISQNKLKRFKGKLDVEVLTKYVRKMSPLYTAAEGRILFMTDNGLKPSAYH